MTLRRTALVATLSVLTLQAEDFNLRYLDAAPVTLHTTLTYEGKSERLVATAKNESETVIKHAKICVVAKSFQKECLFELWNTEPWVPGTELNWNLTTPKRIPDLFHSASIVEFEIARASAIPPPPALTAVPSVATPTQAVVPPPQIVTPVQSLLPIENTNPIASRNSPVILQDGTPLRMRLTRNLSSAEAQSGDRVDFEVLDEVKVGNTLVIASGANAVATITDSEAKRSMGRAGRLDVTLDYVRSVDGEKVRLRGVQAAKGSGHTGAMTGAMVATAVVFWPAAPLFLFMKGKDVKIPKGHEVSVYVDGDQPIHGISAVTAPAPNRETERGNLTTARPATAGKALTNQDVLTLKAAEFADDFIIMKIKASAASFSLDTPDLVKLKQAGLSEAIIGAMVQAAASK